MKEAYRFLRTERKKILFEVGKMMYILTYSLFNTKNIWKLLPGMFIQYIIHHMYHFNNKKDFKTVIIKNIAFLCTQQSVSRFVTVSCILN